MSSKGIFFKKQPGPSSVGGCSPLYSGNTGPENVIFELVNGPTMAYGRYAMSPQVTQLMRRQGRPVFYRAEMLPNENSSVEVRELGDTPHAIVPYWGAQNAQACPIGLTKNPSFGANDPRPCKRICSDNYTWVDLDGRGTCVYNMQVKAGKACPVGFIGEKGVSYDPTSQVGAEYIRCVRDKMKSGHGRGSSVAGGQGGNLGYAYQGPKASYNYAPKPNTGARNINLLRPEVMPMGRKSPGTGFEKPGAPCSFMAQVIDPVTGFESDEYCCGLPQYSGSQSVWNSVCKAAYQKHGAGAFGKKITMTQEEVDSYSYPGKLLGVSQGDIKARGYVVKNGDSLGKILKSTGLGEPWRRHVVLMNSHKPVIRVGNTVSLALRVGETIKLPAVGLGQDEGDDLGFDLNDVCPEGTHFEFGICAPDEPVGPSPPPPQTPGALPKDTPGTGNCPPGFDDDPLNPTLFCVRTTPVPQGCPNGQIRDPFTLECITPDIVNPPTCPEGTTGPAPDGSCYQNCTDPNEVLTVDGLGMSCFCKKGFSRQTPGGPCVPAGAGGTPPATNVPPVASPPAVPVEPECQPGCKKASFVSAPGTSVSTNCICPDGAKKETGMSTGTKVLLGLAAAGAAVAVTAAVMKKKKKK